MMVIDTSALVAIILGEDEAESFSFAIERDDNPVMSCASYIELLLVLKHKKGITNEKGVLNLLATAGITIEPFDSDQADYATKAVFQYPYLNYGDKFSYALAKAKNAPLLFKGNDFSKTDVKAALY